VKEQAQRRTVVYGVEIVPAVRVMLQVELEPESRSGAGNGGRPDGWSRASRRRGTERKSLVAASARPDSPHPPRGEQSGEVVESEVVHAADGGGEGGLAW
jgi:hypothetical protein